MRLSYRNDKNARFISSLYHKSLDNSSWYKITDSNEEETDILIYDYIGWPFNSAEEFVTNIGNIKSGKIVIRINSPGGDVFDANAIYNAIASHPLKPATRIESLAASAASYIFMAGSEKQSYKNSMFMIHEPMTMAFGNQYEFRDIADLLEQISSQMIDMYSDNTGIGKRKIKEMLKDETWLTAKKAKEHGFVDTIIDEKPRVDNNFDASLFSSFPIEQKGEPTIREIEKALRDAGLSQVKAKALIAGGMKADADSIDKSVIDSIQKTIKILRG